MFVKKSPKDFYVFAFKFCPQTHFSKTSSFLFTLSVMVFSILQAKIGNFTFIPSQGWVMESHNICPSQWADFCQY